MHTKVEWRKLLNEGTDAKEKTLNHVAMTGLDCDQLADIQRMSSIRIILLGTRSGKSRDWYMSHRRFHTFRVTR